MLFRRVMVLGFFLCAVCSCTGVSSQNPLLDGGAGNRAQGQACSRDFQCASPLRCVAFICDNAPDAGGPVSSSTASGSGSVSSSSRVASSSAAPPSSATSAPASASGTASSQGVGSGSAAASSASESSSGESTASGASSTAGSSSSGATGFAVGAACTADAECQSALCRAVFTNGDKVCVARCAQAADCAVDAGSFCNPTAAGADGGFCTPASPAHCAECAVDADCGAQGETCVQLAGEPNRSCHVDCSLGGASACPGDYACTTVDVGGGQQRRLCRPLSGRCADALGGFCDRVNDDVPCSETADAGRCTGVRTCGAAGRYTACGAPTPQCRADCATAQPAGCMVSACPAALALPAHCGACNTPCAGAGQASAVVTCEPGAMCTFGCAGENYDVDGQTSTGCEVLDAPTGNHTQATAVSLGSFSCSDGSSEQNLVGLVPADTRTHSPAIAGFSAATGAAPDWFALRATGGFCTNDVELTLQVTSGAQPTCLKLTVITDVLTESCQVLAGGSCTVSRGTGSYTDDSSIFIAVERTCAAATVSNAYTVTGHL